MGEAKAVAWAIFGIIIIIAVVGLVLMLQGSPTGKFAPAQPKLYGGELRQYAGDPLRQPRGEEAWRYVTPVDTNLVEPVYGHRKSWDSGVDPARSSLRRERCPVAYPVITDWRRAEYRDDCIASRWGDWACCAAGGSYGDVQEAVLG